jgi:hypothetical protein
MSAALSPQTFLKTNTLSSRTLFNRDRTSTWCPGFLETKPLSQTSTPIVTNCGKVSNQHPITDAKPLKPKTQKQ